MTVPNIDRLTAAMPRRIDKYGEALCQSVGEAWRDLAHSAISETLANLSNEERKALARQMTLWRGETRYEGDGKAPPVLLEFAKYVLADTLKFGVTSWGYEDVELEAPTMAYDVERGL